jgi:pyridoxal phosphate enzyme (YggS family)
MHKSISNLISIKSEVEKINEHINIIAVSKTFKIDKIYPLLDYGHIHFGENKVQEALEKWEPIKKEYKNIKLHMIGKLQTNKVKFAVRIFDYIHSVDSEKLAKKISDEQNKINKKVKIFIQVNIANEKQKSGVDKDNLKQLVSYCKKIDLDLVGLMCIPSVDIDPENYFKEMCQLNKSLGLNELSMGMSSDYVKAVKCFATFIRVGSSIFGQRN